MTDDWEELPSCSSAAQNEGRPPVAAQSPPAVSAGDARQSSPQFIISGTKPAIVVSGGGPAGLFAGIAIAERLKAYHGCHVYILELRWSEENGEVQWPGDGRRDQVVTLQKVVLDSTCSERTKRVLLGDDPEQMWPSSYQLPIRQVEDRLLARAKEEDLRARLTLVPGSLTEFATQEIIRRDNTLLIIADGAGSQTRTWALYNEPNARPEGIDVREAEMASGVYFEFQGELNKANVVLGTLIQTRHLANISIHQGKVCGFINSRLTQREFDELVHQPGGEPARFRNPLRLQLRDVHTPEVPLPLKSVLGSVCQLFGLTTNDLEVTAGAIHIQPRKFLPEASEKMIDILLIGDAAFTVHFWPGRGMNCAILAAAVAAQTAIKAIKRLHNPPINPEDGPACGKLMLRTEARDFRTYMSRLCEFEADYRSSLVGADPNGSREVPEPANANVARQKLVENIEELMKRARQAAANLTGRYSHGQFQPDLAELKGQLRTLGHMYPTELDVMARSASWSGMQTDSDTNRGLRYRGSGEEWGPDLQFCIAAANGSGFLSTNAAAEFSEQPAAVTIHQVNLEGEKYVKFLDETGRLLAFQARTSSQQMPPPQLLYWQDEQSDSSRISAGRWTPQEGSRPGTIALMTAEHPVRYLSNAQSCRAAPTLVSEKSSHTDWIIIEHQAWQQASPDTRNGQASQSQCFNCQTYNVESIVNWGALGSFKSLLPHRFYSARSSEMLVSSFEELGIAAN